MNIRSIERLGELLIEIVNEPGPWMEKRELILMTFSIDQQTALDEFVSWFDKE